MVSIDTSRLRRRLAELPAQVRFATAYMLTQLAKDGREAATKQIEYAFDKPARFTQSAITIKPANKANLTSMVFAKDMQTGYLAIQETGGERRPQPGASVIVPVNIRLNTAGNIPRGKVRREVAKPTTFVSARTARALGTCRPASTSGSSRRRGRKPARQSCSSHWRSWSAIGPGSASRAPCTMWSAPTWNSDGQRRRDVAYKITDGEFAACVFTGKGGYAVRAVAT